MIVHRQIVLTNLQPGHIQEKRKPVAAKLHHESSIVTEFDPKTVPPHQSLFYAA